MKTILRPLVQLLALLVMVAPASGSPWGTIVATPKTEAERLAAIDLQRYLAQVTGVVPNIVEARSWQARPQPAVILGTAQSNVLLKGLVPGSQDLGPQGYYLANATIRSERVVIAAGLESEGAANAIYGLLRELGFGFFLGSEAIPDLLPPELPVSPVVRRPCFTIRGVLPWYNFFNSPTVWDPVDHRALVDQLIRQGANFVGFHTYDFEPFAAYEENGQMKWGARLLHTQSPNWGTHPMPATEFAHGTDKLFDTDYFGAATTTLGGDSNAVIRLEQDIMRDALAYARKRGLRTCLGFEINGDPTNPDDRGIFLKRINRLLDQYPGLDFLWIWQPETQGAQGYTEQWHKHHLRDRFKPGSVIDHYGIARREVFRRAVEEARGEPPFFQDTETGRAARAREGARLEQFAQLAFRATAHRKNAPRLVISGWGGDERLLSAEYYDGLDKLLPASVAFASLDHIWPKPRVDKMYGALPSSRERWPIPWLELDGDQWHPQPHVHVYEKLARDAQRGGSQGILGIHWRTRDIEENFAFLMDYAWQPGLTAEEFFRQYARRCYPAALAGDMAAIHSELDSMGYRWVNGKGQVECISFGWGPGQDDKAQSLRKLQARVRALLPQAGRGAARLQWLLDEMEWVIRFQQAETAAVKASHLLAQQKPQEALALLDGDSLAQALQAFARRVTTRGEHGVLATINTKAVFAWNKLRQQCLAALNQTQATGARREWNPEPNILWPRLVGSVPAGEALELKPVCLGGKAAWLHYRPLGRKDWKSLPLRPIKGWVQRGIIPANAVVTPGLEVGFSFSSDPGVAMSLGPIAFTVMPVTPAERPPLPKVALRQKPRLHLAAKTTETFPVVLSWNEMPEADYFKVYRSGQLVAETAVAFFPDAFPEAAAQRDYLVEAWRDGKVIAKAKKRCTLPD